MYLGIEKNDVCINLNSISIWLCKLMCCFLLGLSGKAKVLSSLVALFGMILKGQEAHNIINFESLRFSVLILFCWALALITDTFEHINQILHLKITTPIALKLNLKKKQEREQSHITNIYKCK